MDELIDQVSTLSDEELDVVGNHIIRITEERQFEACPEWEVQLRFSRWGIKISINYAKELVNYLPREDMSLDKYYLELLRVHMTSNN